MLNLKTRNNKVWLLNTVLEKDNINQLTFLSIENQLNYFLNINNVIKELIDVSYTRTPYDNENLSYISAEVPIDKIVNCNYVVYKNSMDSKYYFCFVDRLEYKSENVTYIHISLDVHQSRMFEYKVKNCFVERQTPVNDYFNTLSDSVAHGQLVEVKKTETEFSGGYFVFCSSDVTQDVTTDTRPFSLKIGNYTIPCLTLYWSDADSKKMGDTLQRISNKGWSDRIISAVYIPFINNSINFTITPYPSNAIGTINIVEEISSEFMRRTFSFNANIEHEFKKELCYPYAKIVVTDFTTGQTIELAPEKFADLSNIEFELRGNISEAPYYKIIPKNYEGQDYALNHTMVVKCDTTLPILNNLYAKYLMNNKEINSISKMGAYVGGLMSIASGNPAVAVGGLFSTFQQISSITAQENQASMLGNSITSIADGTQERLTFKQGIKIALFTMDDNHKKMSRNYWKMFGYPVKSLDTPNLKGNRYNYLKLNNPNIIGNIPNDELEKIKEMYSRGVTLWHNPIDYLNY